MTNVVTDPFDGNRPVTGPFRNAVSITPADSTAIAITRGLSVNVSGNVAIKAVDGSAAVTVYMAAGVIYPIRALWVNSTNTTATGIVGWY